ncbi:MAG: inositol monophosphatase family protein [Thioalkalivibrionaceae bacterium]
MHPMLNTAITAARKAGRIAAQAFHRADPVNLREKTANDFVTETDIAAERAIIDVLKRAYPDHGFLAEESGASDPREYTWIIDPIDGTTNFIHGIPQFAISIALRVSGRLEQAVVYDPIKEDLFTASRGAGAFLNSQRIRVTTRPDLRGALLGTGIPFREHQDLDRYIDGLRKLLPDTAGVRRPGSAALDLAYVACGRFDGFFELSLNVWDIAAGVLLVQEAGGIVADWRGSPDFVRDGDIVAANPKLLRAMLQRLNNPERLNSSKHVNDADAEI